VVDGVPDETVALERVGAGVGEEAVVEGDDAAVTIEADARLVHLLAVVARRQQVLAPVLHPLDRTAEPQRARGDENLLRID
jgi:hypothetical protein